MRAIPTDYRGVRFRSRTEARWAVLLDGLGVEWRYEHEGFQLPSGWYVPDFWLPGPGLWIEVKGQDPTDRELALCRELADATAKDVALFRGDSCSWWFSAKTESPVRFWARLMEAADPKADLLASLEAARAYRFWDPPAAEPNAPENGPRADEGYSLKVAILREEFNFLLYALYSDEIAALVNGGGDAPRFTVAPFKEAAELMMYGEAQRVSGGDWDVDAGQTLASIDWQRVFALLSPVEQQHFMRLAANAQGPALSSSWSRRDLDFRLSRHRHLTEQLRIREG